MLLLLLLVRIADRRAKRGAERGAERDLSEWHMLGLVWRGERYGQCCCKDEEECLEPWGC